MNKHQRKELLILAAVLAIIPAIFLIVGFMNLFTGADSGQVIGFFVSAAVIAVLCVVVLLIEYNNFRRKNQARANGHAVEAQIDDISILDGVLRVDSHYIQGNQRYDFGVVYGVTTEDMDNKINEKFQNGEMNKITVVVDLAKPKYFEIDVNNWLKDYGIESRLDQFSSDFSQKQLSGTEI